MQRCIFPDSPTKVNSPVDSFLNFICPRGSQRSKNLFTPLPLSPIPVKKTEIQGSKSRPFQQATIANTHLFEHFLNPVLSPALRGN